MRAEKYIFLEETEKATANSRRNQTKKKPNANQEESPRKEVRTLRVEKYHEYTPLNIPLLICAEKLDRWKYSPN